MAPLPTPPQSALAGPRGPEQRAPHGVPVRCQTSAPAPAAPCPCGVKAPAPVPERRLLEAAHATAKRPITALIDTRLNIKIDSPADLTFQ